MPDTITSPKEVVEQALKRDYIGLATFYNLICANRGFQLPPHLVPVTMALADYRISNLLIIVGPGSGKALHIDTPVLCRDGWKPIGQIVVEDEVVKPTGGFARVRAVRKQLLDRLWRVTFADGREVLAHSNHLWKAHHKRLEREGLGRRGSDGLLWSLATTEEIALRLASAKDLRWYVPLVEPVECPEAELPIPPYVLGVVLGDGHIDATGLASVTNPDAEILHEVETEIANTEFEISHWRSNTSGCPVWAILKTGKHLTKLGLRNTRSWNKFVPIEYKQASRQQRLAVLQGLFDTDGSIGSVGNDVSFSTTSFQLAQDVQELVWSLGGIARLTERQTYFTYQGERKPGRKSWRISVRIKDTSQLFRLPRKRDRGGAGQYSETLKLRITSIEREPLVLPSVCISLDSDDGLFIADNYIVTHNSYLLSEIYPAWELGHDPMQSILGISAGELLMQGFMKSVMDIVEFSPIYDALFPKVKPDKAAGWSTERGMFVTGRAIGSPDASYCAAGLDSKALTGKHARIIILDDIHDAENSSSIEQCLKVKERYYNTILGRADPRGARYIAAGRRWNQEDVYSHLKESGEFVVMELPAEREGTNRLYWNVTIPEGLECCFTDEMIRV